MNSVDDLAIVKIAPAEANLLSSEDDDDVAVSGPVPAEANLSSSEDDVTVAEPAPAKHRFHCATCRKTFLTRNGLWHHKKAPCPPSPCEAEHEHKIFHVEFETMVEALQWKDTIEMDQYYSCSQSDEAHRREFRCVVRDRNKSTKLYKRTKKITTRYSSERQLISFISTPCEASLHRNYNLRIFQ